MRTSKVLTPLVALVALALAGCVPAPITAPGASPVPSSGVASPVPSSPTVDAPENISSHGVVLTADGVQRTAPAARAAVAPELPAGTVRVVEVVDPMCPYCGAFSRANHALLVDLAKQGEIAYEVHPISFLDRASAGTEYSTRAASAIVAVADAFPDAAPAFIGLLFRDQPEEGGPGLTDDELVALAAEAGASSPALTEAIESVAYRDLVGEMTQVATSVGVVGINTAVQGTPAVYVDGVQYMDAGGAPEGFEAFLRARL